MERRTFLGWLAAFFFFPKTEKLPTLREELANRIKSLPPCRDVYGTVSISDTVRPAAKAFHFCIFIEKDGVIQSRIVECLKALVSDWNVVWEDEPTIFYTTICNFSQCSVTGKGTLSISAEATRPCYRPEKPIWNVYETNRSPLYLRADYRMRESQ